MKIMHVVGHDNPKSMKGGAVLFKEISMRLGLRGYNVFILATTRRPNIFFEKYSKNVYLLELPYNDVLEKTIRKLIRTNYHENRKIKSPMYIEKIEKLINKSYLKGVLKPPYYKLTSYNIFFKSIDKFDIINASAISTSNSPFLSFLFIKLRKEMTKSKKKTQLFVTPIIHTAMKGWMKPYMLNLLKSVDGVFVSTPFEKEYLKNFINNNVFIIGEGVEPKKYLVTSYYKRIWTDLEEKLKIKKEDKIILWLGRKSFYKGIIHVLIAFSQLIKKYRDIKLLIVGPSDPYENYYSRVFYILKKKYPNNIYDLGLVSEDIKISLLQNMDVLTLPSIAETVPIAVLEAWACKKPVIVADIPTIKSVANINVVGKYKKIALFVKYGDVNSLVKSIEKILVNSEMAKKIGETGYQLVDRFFNWESVTERVERAYRLTAEKKK